MKKDLSDPLNEEKYRVAPGLIHKYKKTVLWLISSDCPIHCNFCTRGRIVGKTEKKLLTDKEINTALKYIEKKKPQEVILSGGDPLFTPKNYLENIINNLVFLQKKEDIKIIRIDTRIPITRPDLIKPWHYKLISKIKNPYILLHINTEEEVHDKVVEIANNFRKKSNALILSQTVLLKNINDTEEKLISLFEKLSEEGLRPYYLYQLDPVPWAKKYEVPFKKAISIWSKLRPKLTGISASVKFVIDVPNGYGKVIVPEGNNWKVDFKSYKDNKGKKIKL
jgi:lysine 2,3-aminomutase